jgi:protein-S-isoprenylcysteine O-methyltransferase Ste14
MTVVRFYLLAGLVVHKAVWELFKRRQPVAAPTSPRAREWPGVVAGAKAAKLLVLLGLVAQTLVPEVLPIATDGAPLRPLGLALYTLGLGTALLARMQLGANWADIESARVLPCQTVVSGGLYRYIRHPIYTGDLLLLAGFELSLNSWLVLGVALLIPFVVHSALREERMLRAALAGYDAYCARTKRFVPYVV